MAFDRIRAIFRVLTTRRNSLVGRLIRLASVWFIISLVITGVVLTAAFHEAALQRFQINVGQIADNLYADTNIGDDGRLLTPEFFDTRTKRIYSGLYWQVGEIDGKGILTNGAASRSLGNHDIAFPAQTLAAARKTIGEAVYYNGVGPKGETPARRSYLFPNPVAAVCLPCRRRPGDDGKGRPALRLSDRGVL